MIVYTYNPQGHVCKVHHLDREEFVTIWNGPVFRHVSDWTPEEQAMADAAITDYHVQHETELEPQGYVTRWIASGKHGEPEDYMTLAELDARENYD